jgi:hypothetical protein
MAFGSKVCITFLSGAVLFGQPFVDVGQSTAKIPHRHND